MEQIQTKSYLKKGLLTFIAVVALVLVISGIALYPRKSSPLPNLTQYLPTSTVFALRADRVSVVGAPHHLIVASARLQQWQDQARDYWQKLEKATGGLHIESVLFAVTEDRGILWQNILLSTSDSITEKSAAHLATEDFSYFSWYPPSTDALHFQRIGDHVAIISSVQDTQDYTSPSSDALALTSDPISLFAKQDIGQQLADMFAVEQVLPGVNGFIRSRSQFKIGSSFAEPRIRLTWYDASTTDAVALPIRVPAQFDLAFSGDLKKTLDSETPTAHPIAATLHSFINTQASTFSFKPDDLQKSMESAQAIIIAGDDWLIAGQDTVNIADLVSLFIGARTPKRSVGILPDGSPYREILRGIPAPQIENLGTVKVSVWSDASLTATSTVPTSSSHALYTAEHDGTWYLSTSKDLLSLQFAQGASSLAEHSLVQACTPSLNGESEIVSDLWLLSSVPETDPKPEKVSLAFISLKSEQNQHIHSLCVQ